MFSFDSFSTAVANLNALVWGWPLDIFVIFAGVAITVALDFVQFRYFFDAWRYVFAPEKGTLSESYITPFQAFLNTLSASVGNGSLAGMATALYAGGPGAAFWVFILGFFNMAIRFAEVFASTQFTETNATGALRGGPMVYLQRAPGGVIIASLYAFFCLMLTFFSGNAAQCNSITLGMKNLLHVPATFAAAGLFLFVLYIMLGGAERIIYYSERIIPIKVGLFFGATLYLLFFHYARIFDALILIVKAALAPKAMAAGFLGFTMQDAMRFGIQTPIRLGMARALNATEAGLGTAAILYGSTGKKDPMRSGLMSMASSFISNHLVCFMLMVVLVASGVWNSGLNSIDMSIAGYQTAFGPLGAWIVTILSVSFGMGVLVAYAYIGRECWMFLTNGKYLTLYTAMYCAMAVFGSLSRVEVLWNALDIVNAGLIVINIYGLLYLLPVIRSAVKAHRKKHPHE